MKPRFGFLALFFFILFIFLALFYGRIVIQNDGLTYYALTISLVEDGDFDLTNQYEHFREIRVYRRVDKGNVASVYSCGFALLYAPFLFAANTLAFVFPAITSWQPYAQNIRIPFRHSLGIFCGSFIFGYLTVLIGCRVLVRQYAFSFRLAAAYVFLLFAGSSLMFYTMTIPSFAHAADAFLLAVVMIVYVDLLPTPSSARRRKLILLGLALSLSVSLRNNNVVLIPPFVLCLLYWERKEGWKHALSTCGWIFVGALPVLILQLAYNYGQYGSFVATGYHIPLTEETIGDRVLSAARFYSILVHPAGGVYIWAPVTLLASAGLVIGSIRGSKVAIVSLLAVSFAILSIRFVGMIWAGGSFAQRFLTHLFIFWVIGIAEVVKIRPRIVLSATLVCFLWTFILFNLYYVNFSSATSRRMLNRDDSRYTPFDMIGALNLEGRNPFSVWYEALQSYPYPSILFLKDSPPARPSESVT